MFCKEELKEEEETETDEEEMVGLMKNMTAAMLQTAAHFILAQHLQVQQQCGTSVLTFLKLNALLQARADGAQESAEELDGYITLHLIDAHC